MEIPPVSKVTALPTSPMARLRSRRRRSEARSARGSSAVPFETATRPPIPQLGDLGAVENVDRDRARRRRRSPVPGRRGRSGLSDVRRQVLQLASAVRALGSGRREAHLGLDRAGVGAVARPAPARRARRLRVVLVAGVEAVEAVAGEDRALDERAGGRSSEAIGAAGKRPGDRGRVRGGRACLAATAAATRRRSASARRRLPRPTTSTRSRRVGRSRVALLERRLDVAGAGHVGELGGELLVVGQPDDPNVGLDSRRL